MPEIGMNLLILLRSLWSMYDDGREFAHLVWELDGYIACTRVRALQDTCVQPVSPAGKSSRPVKIVSIGNAGDVGAPSSVARAQCQRADPFERSCCE